MNMNSMCMDIERKGTLIIRRRYWRNIGLGRELEGERPLETVGSIFGSSTTHDLTLILHFSLDLGTNPSVVKGEAEHNDDNKKTGAMSWGELTELGSSFNTFGLGRGLGPASIP